MLRKICLVTGYYNWTPNEGFSLNGERIKFHGVSLHHDHGALGAEENYKAEIPRLKQMKDMGVNSIRTTHNPASEQTLQIAAELDYWFKKKLLILGMVARRLMTMDGSLIKMQLILKLRRVRSGLTLILEQW